MDIIHLEGEDFDTLIKDGVVLVDFYADWCGPCKMLAPILEDLASSRSDFKIVKVNVDDNRDLAVKYGIMSIPTVMVFKDSKEVEKNIGLLSKDEIISLIEKNM